MCLGGGARGYHSNSSERVNEKLKMPSANDKISMSDFVKEAEREASKILAAESTKQKNVKNPQVWLRFCLKTAEISF